MQSTVVGPFGGASEAQLPLEVATGGPIPLASASSSSIFDLDFRPPEPSTSFKSAFLSPDAAQSPASLLPLLDQVLNGRHEALFDVGLEPDGTPMRLSLDEYDRMSDALHRVAALRDADVSELRCNKSEDGVTGLFLIRRRTQMEEMTEIKVAAVGNVDAGKSTMLGVLTKGVMDDGRGLARQALFSHKHEQETGRTSSVSYEIMGFDSHGVAAHDSIGPTHRLTWGDICARSSKLVSFIDLAGHERYLKTTVYGMTACMPDYVMLMVGANHGVVGMTRGARFGSFWRHF